MPLVQPSEDSIHTYYQLSTELTQARSLSEGAQRGLAILEQCFSPSLTVCAIIWGAAVLPRVFGTVGPTQTYQPGAQERTLLATGECVVRPAVGRQPLRCFAPLRARGELLGWIYLEPVQLPPEDLVGLGVVAAQLGPVLALLDATALHEERVTQLQTLAEIGRSFSSELDLDTLLHTIYTAVCQLVDAPNFYIGLYDAPSRTLDLVYVVMESERRRTQARWGIHEGLTQIIVESRAPLYTDDYRAECKRRGIPEHALGDLPLNKAWLGVPLYAHDNLVGLLNVGSGRPNYTYSPGQVELLVTISTQAAVAIENARLYQRTEWQARELATLNQIGRTLTSSLDPERVPALIMEQVCELLRVEEGSLLLVDELSGDLVFAYTSGRVGSDLLNQRVPGGVGIAGHVAASGTSLIVNDVQHDLRFYGGTDQATGFMTRALLAVPLRGVGGVQGVIEVLNPRQNGTFDEDDRRLLEAMADQAVIALENARTFAQIDQALARRAHELAATNDQLEHNLQSLTALSAVALAIHSALRRPEDIFALTARGVVELTQARGACVVLFDHGQASQVAKTGVVQPLPVLAPLVREVMQSGRPRMFHGALAAGETLFAVPLRALQRTQGALCVFYGAALPDRADQETIALFATQAAGAVENIDLFTEARSARDAMDSILASTRDGVILIGADEQIALTNTSLARLSGVEPQQSVPTSVQQFLAVWQQASGYAAAEWRILIRGLNSVLDGSMAYASGELNATRSSEYTLEWSVLKVEGSAAKRGGALLIVRDITDAKEASRLRNDLTNMIVHDLRSPLSSVMAALELLQKGAPGSISATQHNILQIAHNSSDQMLGMINTLLDISRFEDGRLPVNTASCAVAPLIERARERLISLAQDRAVLIQADLAENLPMISADADLVVRVLQNMLGNALKFSGRGSTVLVRAWVAADQHQLPARPVDAVHADAVARAPLVCIAVSDRGIGIAAKDQEKIFGKFAQVSDHGGGSGLGLTFCKLAVEAHGGAIWVESALGQGSTFFFTLPVAPAEELGN